MESGGYRLAIDDEAVARVVSENPRLERDALLYLLPMLERQLDSAVGNPDHDIPQFIQTQSGFPVVFSEARFTQLPQASGDALGTAISDLVNRVVHPRRRHSGGSASLVDLLDRHLRPLVRQNIVSANYL